MKDDIKTVVIIGLISLIAANMFSAFVVAWLTPADFWKVVMWLTIVEAVFATIQISYYFIRSKIS